MEMISIPEDVVTVMFNPGVGVERAMLELLEDGGGTPLEVVMLDPVVIAGGAVDELVSGNGLLGESEFVPVEPVDDGGGGMIPLPPVELAVKVLLATVRFALPKETVSTTVTTGTLRVGGISPLLPPLIVVAVEPAMTITVDPSETVSVVVGTGGMTPDKLVEFTVNVVPELVTTISVTYMLVKFAGEMRPLPPVEVKANVEPDVVVLRPRVVVLTSGHSGPGALGEGGMSPSVPVEMIVAVDPETTTTVEPTIVVAFPLGAGRLDEATAPVVGGIIPAPPVEVAVAVEKMVVISLLPEVVVAGTKLGPNSPPLPPFTMTLVEEPEIIVVVAPLMMVVISSEMMVLGNSVAGCCTTV